MPSKTMHQNELEVLALMESVRAKYFPDLQGVIFETVYNETIDGIHGQAVFGTLKVSLHYSDKRILETKYRAGLIPVIAHELAHFIDPVDPERVMRGCLPAPMMTLWNELLKEGYAKCSMSLGRNYDCGPDIDAQLRVYEKMREAP